MPKLPVYLLRWSQEKRMYELTRNGRPEQRFEKEDGRAWLSFLETCRAFTFQGREGQLSLRKESRRRGAGYWYAYHTSGQRTLKRYFGNASRVTFAGLEEAAGALGQADTGQSGASDGQSTAPAALLLSKLLPPRLPSSLVERPRLLARLNEALESRLTLLMAPAGYGKTTVVNQWRREIQARGCTRSLAWVALDAGDNDVFRFWRSLITACQAFQPRLGQETLDALARTLPSPFTVPPEVAALTPFLNDLTRLPEGALLVLDDYHLIEEPRVHNMLAFFLEHLPATCGVVLLTRSEPRHLPLLRWRARGELCELRGADLRFSPEETASFVRQSTPLPFSEAALAQVEASLQGWVAGLRLLILALSSSARGEISEQAIARALAIQTSLDAPASPYRSLLDYFTTEILNAQAEPMQRFLLYTSILTRLNGPLCEAVTGVEDGAAHLAAIAQAGLFLEALDDTWYHFHALFAEALRREAAARLGEETLHTLSLRASHWYEQHTLIAEAVETALLAQDFARAARLIEQMMDRTGQIAELYTTQRWLACLPEEILYAHPLLCWLAALALQVLPRETPLSPAERARVEVLLRMAEQNQDQQKEPDLAGLIASLRAIDAWRAGAVSHAIACARQALTLLPSGQQLAPLQLWRGVCLFITGIGYLSDGAFAEALAAFREAHTCSLASGDEHFIQGLLILGGACSYLLGEIYQAREYYQRALLAGRQHEDREIVARALLGLAAIAFDWNQLALAEQQAGEALQLAPEAQQDVRAEAALQLAKLAHARGQSATARQQIDELLAHLQMESSPATEQRLADVLLFSAHLALEAGEPAKAGRTVEMLSPARSLAARIFQARLLISQGGSQEAITRLEHLLPEAAQWPLSLEIQLLLSLAHAARGESSQARQWLWQALTLARGMELIRPFLAEKEPVARLLRQLLPALGDSALRSYAQTLLRAFTLPLCAEASADNASANQLAEPLSAQEERVLRLLAAGHSNREIAQTLVISLNTVKDHAKHLYRKLGISNRQQASEAARRLKLI